MIRPLILTLMLDAASQSQFDEWRTHYFPPERNVIGAHMTLFHALDGSEETEILTTIQKLSQASFCMVASGVRSLGHGVAVTIESPALARLRGELAAGWKAMLTPQDRQAFRAHVTIQNKVSAAAARQLMESFGSAFVPFAVEARGLELWRYMGGPWEAIEAVRFSE